MSDFLDLGLNHEFIGNETSNDYYTPRFIFDALNVTFDIDVCAPFGGVPWLPAKSYFTVLDDGLVQPWNGLVWMNPPYSKTTPWIDKFIQHSNGIGLLFTGKSEWFNNLWKQADGILLLPPTLKFHRYMGEEMGIYSSSVLIAMGGGNVDILKASGLGHVR